MCPPSKIISRYADQSLSRGQQKKLGKHLKSCEDCRSKLEKMQSLQSLLGEIDLQPSTPCLSPREFMIFASDGGSEEEISEWKEHLLECANCRQDYAYLKETEELEKNLSRREVPTSLKEKLKSFGPSPTVKKSSSKSSSISLKGRSRRNLARRSHRYKGTNRSHTPPVAWIMGMAAALLLLAAIVFFPGDNRTNHSGTTASNTSNGETTPGDKREDPPSLMADKKEEKSPKSKPDLKKRLKKEDPNDQSRDETPPLKFAQKPAIDKTIHQGDNRPDRSPLRDRKEREKPQDSSGDPIKTQPRKTPKEVQPRRTAPRTPVMLACLKGRVLIRRGKNSSYSSVKKKRIQVSFKDQIKIGSGGALLSLSSNSNQLICAQKNTRLKFSQREKTPQIHLSRGRALFAFHGQGKSPVPQVDTDQAQITVTGTEFMVKANSSATYLTVIEGSVKCSPRKNRSQSQTLLRGQRARISSGGKLTIQNYSGDKVDRLASWSWKLRPRIQAQFNFESDGYWRGWVAKNNTFKESKGSLRALPINGNKFWGVKMFISKEHFSFKAQPNQVIRFAYHLDKPSRILLQLWDKEQSACYHYKIKNPKIGEWTIVEIPIDKLRQYFDKKAQIKNGDTLHQIELFSGTPQDTRILFLIDNFIIYRKK